eukprot:TRINITY_DN7714_c0_g1_i1.p1 TRINITY_DN7714_c0_g1~~TRINITY_DN7714_c0_g1_i1.p1  ORF type:complete len:384 (+),score=8.91 TRINITY_DN7714_c0_g1_i1:211-1362(+)
MQRRTLIILSVTLFFLCASSVLFHLGWQKTIQTIFFYVPWRRNYPHRSIRTQPGICTPLDNSTQSKPIILFWTSFFRFPDPCHVVFLRYEEPACLKCQYTSDRSLAHKAKAIVFHGPSFSLDDLPPQYCHQKWVLWNQEPPALAGGYSKHIDLTSSECVQMFDISVSYRFDADIFDPYFPLGDQHRTELLAPVDLSKKSDVPGVWIASNCEPFAHHRLEYVRQLDRYIPIDRLGRCLRNREIPDAPVQVLMRPYKFYLAFENSICPDYVTEKLWNALQVGLVPVVIGPSNIDMFAPTNHSIINALDFAGPRDLAAFLWRLHLNRTEYLRYLSHKFDAARISPDYRARWMAPTLPRACRLCDLVASKNQTFRGVATEKCATPLS